MISYKVINYYFCIIGILLEIYEEYMIVKVENDSIKVFYKGFDGMHLEVKIGTLVKIEGKISNIGFPFDVVVEKNIYSQIIK